MATYLPGCWIGACGEIRLDAGAKYSSDVERMRELREAEIKSGFGGGRLRVRGVEKGGRKGVSGGGRGSGMYVYVLTDAGAESRGYGVGGDAVDGQ